MDVEGFWRFLERSAQETTDLRQRADWLEHRLSRIALDHVVDFQVHLDTARRLIDTYDMWGAANQVMDGHCSGDAFWYFQPWLIGQGQHWWRRVRQHPDNLADVPAVRLLAGRGPDQWADSEWPHWEELADVAARAYDSITGQEDGIEEALSERGRSRPFDPEPVGTPWDSDSIVEIERRVPRLSRLFPRQRYVKP